MDFRGQSMYLHKKTYELKYTDVDENDKLKLSALFCFMEQSACLSADELGFGYKDIAPKQIGFIITNWYLELFREIRLGESLTVHTWPIKPQRLIIFRDFEFYVGDEKVGVATTRWCLVNLNTFSLLPSAAFFAGDTREYNDFRSVDFAEWKIHAPEDGKKVYEKGVVASDLDHYHHVNNTKYCDFVLDIFSPEELKNKRLLSAQMTYVKQCKYGETLGFFVSEQDGFCYIEGKVGEELRVAFKAKFAE
jgi:acyl-ACP thioesterase